MKRLLRDHSLTTTPGSGFLTPLNTSGVNAAVGAMIGLTTVFLFFSTLYIAYVAYSDRTTLAEKQGVAVGKTVVTKETINKSIT